MSQKNEIFLVPSTSIPQIAEDLNMLLQGTCTVKIEQRMTEGYELQIKKNPKMVWLGMGMAKKIYLFPAANGKVNCEISGGELGELVLPISLGIILLFLFFPLALVIFGCVILGVKQKGEFDTYIFRNVEKLSEQYKEQHTISKVSIEESTGHICSRCGYKSDTPGFCPECGNRIN